MSAQPTSKGLQVPILGLLVGGVLISSALKGQSIIDVLASVGSDPLNPKGHSRGTPVGTPTDGGTVSGTLSNSPVVPSKSDSANPGSPVPGQTFHSSTHPTAGLPGYPAYDYMAPAGTPCVAPTSGKITRISGKDPRLGGSPGGPLGYSIYLKGSNGKTYFMTHLDKVRVTAGQSVVQGQQIAEVANGPASWSSPHVHMGVKG